jgi:hypothetical protein
MKKIFAIISMLCCCSFQAFAIEVDTDADGLIDREFLEAGEVVVSDADGITLTVADTRTIVLMTGAGEVGLWDCSTANIGTWAMVWVRDASEQVEVVMSGDTTNDLFVLVDGTELDADDEADMATTAGTKATFICLEENKWYVNSAADSVTDGGAAD